MNLKDLVKTFPKTALATLLASVGIGGGAVGANMDGLKDILLAHKHGDLISQVAELEAKVHGFESMERIPATVPATLPQPAGKSFEQALAAVTAHIDSKVLYTCTGEHK